MPVTMPACRRGRAARSRARAKAIEPDAGAMSHTKTRTERSLGVIASPGGACRTLLGRHRLRQPDHEHDGEPSHVAASFSMAAPPARGHGDERRGSLAELLCQGRGQRQRDQMPAVAQVDAESLKEIMPPSVEGSRAMGRRSATTRPAGGGWGRRSQPGL
jgi:hypothetical protein